MRIANPNGEVRRFFREDLFHNIAIREVYMTDVKPQVVKAWKRHRRASLFLSCISGEVILVWRENPAGLFRELILTTQEPKGVLMPCGTWFGFKGAGVSTSTLLCASTELHDPTDVEVIDQERLDFDWGVK